MRNALRRDPHTHPPPDDGIQHEVEHAAAHVSRLEWLTTRATVLLLGLVAIWAQLLLTAPSLLFDTQGYYQVERTMTKVDRVQWTTTHNGALLIVSWFSFHAFSTGTGVEYSPVGRARFEWAPNLYSVLRPPTCQRVNVPCKKNTVS